MFKYKYMHYLCIKKLGVNCVVRGVEDGRSCINVSIQNAKN